MFVRKYGTSGPAVVLVHGGPGAPGSLAPVGRELADGFRVLEPFQRRSGEEELRVATHVDDLRVLLETELPGERPHLVGHSFGAMLALAFAADHPERIATLTLVGCGTFDSGARALLQHELARRTSAAVQARLDELAEEFDDADERLRAVGEALLPIYSHELHGAELELDRCDARGHEETWNDMLRLQAEGRYPAAFAAFRGPARMIHGVRDPHPARAIHAGLRVHLPELELLLLEECGHYPWLERAARDEFLTRLRDGLPPSGG